MKNDKCEIEKSAVDKQLIQKARDCILFGQNIHFSWFLSILHIHQTSLIEMPIVYEKNVN